MPCLPTGLTQAQMRDRIHDERRVELCFEITFFLMFANGKKEKYFLTSLLPNAYSCKCNQSTYILRGGLSSGPGFSL
jgi:hypothetical protein